MVLPDGSRIKGLRLADMPHKGSAAVVEAKEPEAAGVVGRADDVAVIELEQAGVAGGAPGAAAAVVLEAEASKRADVLRPKRRPPGLAAARAQRRQEVLRLVRAEGKFRTEAEFLQCVRIKAHELGYLRSPHPEAEYWTDTTLKREWRKIKGLRESLAQSDPC
jgi:hypothetical protein